MKLLRSITLFSLTLSPLAPGYAEDRSLTEFASGENKALDWKIVDDGVMGGLSRGTVSFTDAGTLRFAGDLSLENNGGFSSVRTKTVRFDLSDCEGLAMRVKGDGRSYDLRLNTDARYSSGEVSFKAEFPTTKGEWREVKVPFTNFVASWRGRTLETVFDPAKVQRVGLLLGDKKPGPFQLEVDWIRAYGASATGKGGGDLVETAAADGRFQTLVSALTKAELVAALQGEGPLTVFAPTDEAFAKLPKAALAELLEPTNKKKLQAVLKYHVVSGRTKLSDALKAGEVATLQGNSLNVAFSNGQVRVKQAALVDADVECANGVIHVIDSVLLLPQPKAQKILDVAAAAGKFDTLLSAIDAAGLKSVLAGEGSFTVFAPTDAAIAQLPEATLQALLKEENREQLKAVLTYHVVSGRVSAGDALNARTAETLQGAPLKFSIQEGTFRVNESIVRSIDLECANGVIHVIDAVLLPPSSTAIGVESKEASATSPAEAQGPTAQRRILNAIDKGVPLYNQGNPAACARVYAECLESLVNDKKVTEDVRRVLAEVLNKAAKTRGDDARAWLLRRTLDGALAHLQPRH